MISLTPNRTGVHDLSNGISVGTYFILLGDHWLVVHNQTTEPTVSMVVKEQEGAHLSGRRKALFQLGSFRFSPHLAQQACIVPYNGSCAGMLRPQHLISDSQGARKVGERVLIAQELAPPPSSQEALLPPSPLRTVQASFPAYRSSLSNAP
jgi:hypothetical protein